jgi:anthranilate synthase component 1
VNPSPYLFFLRTGSSADRFLTEVMVRLDQGIAELKPSRDQAQGHDRAGGPAACRRAPLDPKERAEHVMLVDLGRNDLGWIARIGASRSTNSWRWSATPT